MVGNLFSIDVSLKVIYTFEARVPSTWNSNTEKALASMREIEKFIAFVSRMARL